VRRLALAALLAAAAAPAGAEVVSTETMGPSPRWGAFQLSFATLEPNIDSGNFSGGLTSTPYATVFGTNRPLLTQILFSRSAWMTEVGTLDVGLGIGYWQANGKGIAVTSSGTVTGGSTSLVILPLQLAAGYRFDIFYDQWGVPFEPYARIALVDDIWWTSGQSGISSYTNPSTGQSSRGQGSTYGWAGTVGLALVLDALDPTMARQMDFDTGINHTMLFFDFTKGSVNDFGSNSSWQLAPSYWMWSAGILFVF